MSNSSSYNIYLDDERIPIASYNYTQNRLYLQSNWILVKSYDEFVKVIETNFNKYLSFPETISFDHDLHSEHYNNDLNEIPYDSFNFKTGYDCAMWLIDFCFNNKIKFPEYLIHSSNPIGKRNIQSLIQKFIKFQIKDLKK